MRWDDADITQSPDAEMILFAGGARRDGGGSFRSGDRVRHNTFGEGIVFATRAAVSTPRSPSTSHGWARKR